MTSVPANTKCPNCGAAVESTVAGGLCPACLLRQAALGTGTGSEPSSVWTPPTVAELAAVFPQLEILELIGHGGMGAVYKARQKSLGRLVALKILAPHHATNPDFAERFAREAKVLAEVNHPNIVTVHDFGQAGEFYFLTMEFVDGVNLRQAMSAGRLTPQQALAIVPPICEALQFAHEHGIVHRDIKPENLLLDKDGRIKIADFGIARMMRQDVGQASSLSNPDGPDELATCPADLTQQSVLGTPQYMAPEQRDAPSVVDHRADIYSLGVVLYEMLTGELPGAKLEPPSKKLQIDVRLDKIVLRALERVPELRFQSATEFRTQVDTLTHAAPDESPAKQIAGLPLRSRGHFTTPERIKTFFGQLFFHQRGAEFSLDARQLAIRYGGIRGPFQETIIPLAAIQDVSLGRYPALVNPHGLNYVHVIYQQKDETQQIYFTPQPDRWSSLAALNLHVAEWCDAILAVQHGREPVLIAADARSSEAPALIFGSHSDRWRGYLFLMLGVFFVLVFLFGGGVVTSSNGGYWTAVFTASFAIGLLFPGVLVYLSAAAPVGKVANSPHVPVTQSLLIGLGVGFFLITGPAWLLFFRSGFFASNFGQHAFMIAMGIGLAQLFPLGIGVLLRASPDRNRISTPLVGLLMLAGCGLLIALVVFQQTKPTARMFLRERVARAPVAAVEDPSPPPATEQAALNQVRPIFEIPHEQLPVSGLALAWGGPVQSFDVRSVSSFTQLDPRARLRAEEVSSRFEDAWHALDAVTGENYERIAGKLIADARPLHPMYRAVLLNAFMWRIHENETLEPKMRERIIVEATLAALDESPIDAGSDGEIISQGGADSIPLGPALRMLERAALSPQSLAKSEASFDWPEKRRRIAELWLTHLARLPQIIDPEWEWLPVVINNGPDGQSPEQRRERDAEQLQNARNNERNSQQRTARELWKRSGPQLRQFLRLAYALPPENTAQRDAFLQRVSQLTAPVPEEPPAEILGSNYWSIDFPNTNAELLAEMTDWVVAWDVQADAVSGGRREARLRVFPDGRVAAVSGLGAPLTETQISPDEVQDLVEVLKQQATERPAATDPLPEALWNQQAQRVAVRANGEVYDLLTIDTLYEAQREPWSRQPLNQISGKAQEQLLRVFHLAVIGGPVGVDKYAATANAELQREIPATPVRLTIDDFSSAGYSLAGTLVVGFRFSPDDRQRRYPRGSIAIGVPKGGEPFVFDAEYWIGDGQVERWGRRGREDK